MSAPKASPRHHAAASQNALIVDWPMERMTARAGSNGEKGKRRLFHLANH